MKEPTDVELVAQSKPIIRTIAAFLLFSFGKGEMEVERAYRYVDSFYEILEKDLKEQSTR